LKRKMAEEAEEELTFSCEQPTYVANDVTAPVDNYVNVEVAKFSNNDVTHSTNNYENLDLSKKTKRNQSNDVIQAYENADVIQSMTNSTKSQLSHRSSSHMPTDKKVPNRHTKVTTRSSPAKTHEKLSPLSNSTNTPPTEIREQSIHTTERITSKQTTATASDKDASNRYEICGFML